jgi:1-acyl-sn-glycerol-3-phosphate acyltransferase
MMAKCPIVPVALVDSYKVYNSPHKGPVTTYLYFLEPLYYDDYKGMRTPEIAALVEERIREKVQEHTG